MKELAAGRTAVICRSNSLPSFTDFNSACNDSFVHCGSDNLSGSSKLLTIRMAFVSVGALSLENMNVTIDAETSIGFQTVPLISSTTFVCPGSLQITVACLLTAPLKLPELN